MQKKYVVIGFAVAAVAAVIFWARLNAVQNSGTAWQGASPVVTSQPAAQQNLPPRKSPDEYNAMMGDLSQNLQNWQSLHPDDQRLAVAAIMQLLAQQKRGTMTLPPAYYAERINQTMQVNQEVMTMPLDRVLVIMAVMDYDFDNGQDKELLAQEVLGPAMYAANKARREQLKAAQ